MQKLIRCHACNGELKIQDMTTPQRIKYWRLEIGLTQKEMGVAVGKNRQWIANLEAKRPISLTNAKILADYYGVTLDLLLRGRK